MTPHLFYVDASEYSESPDSIVVAGPEGHHAVTVKRIRIGEVVWVSDGSGRIASGPVTRTIGKDSFVMAVEVQTIEAAPVPLVSVVQAAIKADRLELAVEAMTEAGVDRLMIWPAERSIARVKSANAGSQEARNAKATRRLERHVWEAAKQARRARRPELDLAVSASELTEIVRSADRAYVLDEQADLALSDVSGLKSAEVQNIVLIVGPEGGLTDSERTALVEAGATLVRMGKTVLRASTAGTVALGWLMGATDRWKVSD